MAIFGWTCIAAGLAVWGGRWWYLARHHQGAPRWPWSNDPDPVERHNAKGEHWREAE